MKQQSIHIQNPVQELFFIIAPPPHIMSDVSVLKDDVHYLTGKTLKDRYSKAYISLFKYADEHIDDMLRHVESKAAAFKPFNVFIKNFSVFYQASGRTVYMDIINKYPIREIFEKLIREDAEFTPHITIARNLSVEDFMKAWPYLDNLPYSQHFTCDRITVLARGEKHWVHYKDILFGGTV